MAACQTSAIPIIRRVFCLFSVTVLIWTLLVLSGCTELVVFAGYKTYMHLRGDLLGVIPEKLDNVYAASLKAAGHLDRYEVVDSKLTAINGTIEILDPEAEKISIELAMTENNNTQIQIKVGAFGDTVKSVYLYDCIQAQLGVRQPDKNRPIQRI